MQAAMEAVEFDAVEGMPALRSTGVAVTLVNLRGLKLGPAMEMLCRARLMLGGKVFTVDGPALEYKEQWGERRKETHINLQVQATNVHEVCLWCARIAATHVLTGDGS